MKFEFGFSGPGRRNLIIGLIALVIIASIIVIVLRSRSTYQFPIPVSDNSAEGGTLTSAIALCTTNYRQALQQGLTDSSPTPKTVCVQNAVTNYFNSKCRFVVEGTVPNADNGQAAVNAYNQYTGGGGISGGGDAGAVTGSTQYINLGIGAPPNGLTPALVTKARKADLTGPTRKYIGNACTGFYKPADSTATDLSAIYISWTSSASTVANAFGFDASKVTGPRVYEWAIKAGTPITVAADVASGITAFTVSPSFSLALTSASKVKIGSTTYTVAANPVPTISSFSVTTAPTSTITAGTSINISTASAISSVAFPVITPNGSTFDTTNASPPATPYYTADINIPNTSGNPSSIYYAKLNLANVLTESLAAGSQVLISGSTLSGQITIHSIDQQRLTVVVKWSAAQSFPILPPGSTIENVIETPMALPLVTSVPVYVTTAYTTGATSSSSITLAVNAGATGLSSTAAVVTVPTVTFPVAAAVLKASISGTNLTLSAFGAGGTAAATITWPTIPAGTVIFDSVGMPFVTSGTNTLYNQVGTMAGQKMLNWQIAQVIGPGTYLNGGSPSTSAVAWGIA